MSFFGIFGKGDKDHGGQQDLAKTLTREYLVKRRYGHCLRNCLMEDVYNNVNEEEKLCLAMCVDKLHRRYDFQELAILEAVTESDKKA